MALRKIIPERCAPSVFRSLDLDEGTLEIVKATSGFLLGGWAINLHADTNRFLKLYNAASGTAGTGTPLLTIPLKAGVPTPLGDAIGDGIQFSTGICAGATTGVADNDTGAPGANEVVVFLLYA
jgi:hypothetical protein